MISLSFEVHSRFTLVGILMTQVPFKDYKCSCGKLLFRAEPLRSPVEVKCKRCGAVRVYGAKDDTSGFISFTFVTSDKKNGKNKSNT